MQFKPTSAQLKYNDLELGIFFHFGIRTFNEEHRPMFFVECTNTEMKKDAEFKIVIFQLCRSRFELHIRDSFLIQRLLFNTAAL